ncbi:MAG: hypothetical protein V4701_01200 [Pseudomonadota bacterium]
MADLTEQNRSSMNVTLVASLALAIQAAAAATPEQASPPTPEDFQQARTGLAARLEDYASTNFRNTHGNSIMFCGELNTKTNTGVYTGWVSFGILHYDQRPARVYLQGRDDRLLELCDASVEPAAPSPTGTDYSGEMFIR